MNTPNVAAAWRRRTHARSLGDGLYRLVAGKPGIKLAIAHQPAATPSRRPAGLGPRGIPIPRQADSLHYAVPVDRSQSRAREGAVFLGGEA